MQSINECVTYPYIVTMHVQLDELVLFIYSSKIQNQNRKNRNESHCSLKYCGFSA